MSLKLYYAVGSPPSRGVLLLIRTLKLNVEVITLNLGAGDQMSEEFLKLNPFHQVPVLVDGDFVLCESRAILGYLVSKYAPESTLYPSEVQARALVDQRLYYDATVFAQSILQIIVSMQFERERERV
jgi:glutathione S-transferase